MGRFAALLTVCAGLLAAGAGAEEVKAPPVEMADIPAGSFVMGNDDAPLWDQKPARMVTLSRPFRVSVTEITLEQYRRFRPDWDLATADGFVCGVSWHDAVAFCDWLSRAEKRPFGLPTEAEWEYVRRSADAWGVRGMANDVREWCLDWYGPYPPGAETDPAGAASGMARVVRGGVLDLLDGKFECLPPSEYDQPAYRAGMPPGFGAGPCRARTADGEVPGRHQIGFRIVEGALPGAPRRPVTPPFMSRGVIQANPDAATGPDAARPYFRKRPLLPSPPETETDRERLAAHQRRIEAAGLDPAFRGHNHSPALEVCDNGDLLLVIFTSQTEYEPEMSLMGSRLRFGADTWDMPSCLVDCPGACDNTPLLWKDNGRVHLFWAWSRATGAYPFQWTASDDHGASWGETRFPCFAGDIGPHSRQPINRAFRAADGTVYLPSDAVGGSSVLWASRDNLQTWTDTGGRSAGRHTVYAELRDGRLLALGGKNTDVGGFMPKAVSADGGKTWEVSASTFPALAVNQRPSLLRLQSGRLFFAGDFQKREGVRPPDAVEAGSFAALSDDDGETWHIRKLPGAQEHESGPQFFNSLPGATTLGYSVARQAPNGVIHLVTTMNRPCLHFEMNEAWILAGAAAPAEDRDPAENTARTVSNLQTRVETHPGGAPRITWTAGTGDDGRVLLHGVETWQYPDGAKEYEVRYALGRKTGLETLWRPDGSREWEWDHGPDGVSRWTQWWENGEKKAESTWRDFRATGTARTWDRSGKLVSEMDMGD